MFDTAPVVDFRHLFEAAPGLSIVVLPDMTVAAVTDDYLQATMLRREDIAGRNLFDVFPDNPDDGASHGSTNVRASLEKVFQTGEPDVLPLQKYDVQRPVEDGGGFEERYWRISSFPGFGTSGAVTYVLHRVEDITEEVRLAAKSAEQERRAVKSETERKQAEDALEDARLRLEAALEAGKIGTWNWDVINDRVFADKSLERLFSVSPEIAAGGAIEHYLSSIHEDDRRRVENVISESLQNSNGYEAEFRVVQSDGAIRWIVARGKVVRNKDAQPVQLPGVVIDITDRKKSEEALRESEERFQLVSQATYDAIWDWNLETNELWWNEGVYSLFGYAPGEVESTIEWWYEHIHPEDRDRVVASIHGDIDNGRENWSDEYRFLRPDGSCNYVFDRGFAIYHDGKPVRMLGAMQDITARKRAEEAYLQSQERLQIVLEASELGLWYCDLPFDVLNWSDRTKEHFWLPPDAVVTIDLFYELIHSEDREATKKAIEKSISDRTHYDVEYRTVNPQTGEIKWIRAIGRGFYDQNNNPYRFDGITIDITRDKQIEAEREQLLQLEQSARAEAENANRLKDEFLATLSHELRTPLTSILGWSRMLNAGQLENGQITRAHEIIERNAKVQLQLIEDVLDVSRIVSGKLRLNVQAVNLSEIIEAAIDSVRPAADAKEISIHKVLDENAAPFTGDADRLQQIVWNLLSNAIKFTPKGARVEIRLQRRNSQVEIIVTDNGQGIEAEALPYIFERFRQADGSSTRRHGGLGLGLAIVRNLVEQHGGTVRAESAGKNQGATFIVALPLPENRTTLHSLSENPDEHQVETSTGEANFACPVELKGLRVLVVDDEDDTRDLISSVLARCQAVPIAVSSVSEALAAIEQIAPDVLVSDIGMPDADGYDLIKKIRKLDAASGGQIPAVALTAFARVEDRVRALSAGFQMHVPKPIEPAELVTIVASLANWHNRGENS